MAKFAMQLMLLLLGVLPFLALANPAPAPVAEPEPEPLLGLPVIPLVDALLAIGASPPPPILQTQVKSPECANINQGEHMCCRGIIAGDLQPVVFVAALFGYNLNPNDINGLDCKYNGYLHLSSLGRRACLRECLSILLDAARVSPLLIRTARRRPQSHFLPRRGGLLPGYWTGESCLFSLITRMVGQNMLI